MAHHRRGLRRLLGDEGRADAIADDWRAAQLPERHVAMLDYAEKLSACPPAVERGDVERLRTVGFEDADVLAIAECAGYYAFVNRIVEGLGVELEGDCARP